MDKRTVRIPGYMEKFSCIGSECPDTCCSGWKINIDQAAYQLYEKLADPPVNPLLHMKRNESGTNPEEYAEIVLDSSHTCPLLDENKLCTVHKNMGERYLANLCATYPRSTNIINGVYESAATVSCPEAARLALLNPSGISFVVKEEAAETRHIIKNKLETDERKSPRTLGGHFLEVREFTIQLLQNRRIPISDRLMLLGLFCDELQERFKRGRAQEVSAMISNYHVLVEEGRLQERISAFPSSAPVQINVLRRLVDMRVFKGVTNRRYLQCLMQALQGIEYSGDTLREHSVTLYNQAYSEYYAPYAAKHEYILENYLVNLVFTGLFPAGNGERIFECYVILAVKYALIKFHLIGMAGFHKEAFGSDHVLLLIQSYAKTMEHTPSYSKEIIRYLEQNNHLNIENMALLISNK